MRRLFALLAIVALLFAAPIPSALAQDDNETEDDEAPEAANETDEHEDENETDARDEDDDEDERSRSVEVDRSSEGIKIEFEKEDPDGEDEVEMGFEYEDATFEISYASETANRSVERELEATFQTLAEIQDANDNGRYDPGEEIVSAWALGEDADEDEIPIDGNAEWGQASLSEVEVDGQRGHRIVAPATFGDEGRFELRFTAVGADVTMNGTSLGPTSAKIDIVIDAYPFQANDTIPVLFMETETQDELEIEDDDEETGTASTAKLGDTEVTLRFTWKDTAMVDGSSAPVGTTILESEQENETDDDERSMESERRFVLSYERGDRIVHDPKAEVGIQSASVAGAPGFGALAVLAATVIAVVTFRRRGEDR